MKYENLRIQEAAEGVRCYFVSHGGRHDRWYSPITGNRFSVPRHDAQEIPTGTLRVIKKQAGI